jgi:hypothetical protein
MRTTCTAQAQLAVAQANVRGLIGQARSNRFKLARAKGPGNESQDGRIERRRAVDQVFATF